MWDRGPYDNSVTCNDHMRLIQQRWVYDDRHPIGPDCTMPEALWEYDNQRCAVPGESTLHNAAVLLEPAP